jgi:hypothetical protein
MQGCELPLANSPNASKIPPWRLKIKVRSPGWQVFKLIVLLSLLLFF